MAGLKDASLKKIIKFGTLITLAFALGWIHHKYVSTIFENDTHYSHLSETEREMYLVSEAAFYYSYYKTLVQERSSFLTGIFKLLYDQKVEYPDTVNALNRFNIHPEVIIGVMYRCFQPMINKTRRCRQIFRGRNLSPLKSCIGIGEPIMFYLEAIWWLAGLTVAALFLYATFLSESIFGGLLATAQYFANHVECTRVQWYPNQRENMAMPLLVLQAWLLSIQLRASQRRQELPRQVTLFIINCLCLIFWQFTQFIFLTQIAIIFVMEQLRIISIKTLCVMLYSHFSALHIAVLLMHWNDMLRSSLYVSFCIVASTYCLLFSHLRIKIKNRFDLFVEAWLVLLRIFIVTCASLYLKKTFNNSLNVQGDSHIWPILYSKFTNYMSTTLVYTSDQTFDFLPWSSIQSMLQTFLIPYVFLGIFNVCNYCVRNALCASEHNKSKETIKKYQNSDTEDSGIENTEREKVFKEETEEQETTYWNDNVVGFFKRLHVDPAIFYNVSQLFAYGIMAALVARLKFLFSMKLCVISSLMMNSKYYLIPKKLNKKKYLLLLCLLPLLYKLAINTSTELEHFGEYSNQPLEELLSFVRSETSEMAVFAGSLPTLAIVLLNTGRPIVAHPHYEHIKARQRSYTVLKIYGRFPHHEVYQELKKLKATYLIVNHGDCYGKYSNSWGNARVWDVEKPELAHRPQLCDVLLKNPMTHFHMVYANRDYTVFWIHEYSGRYMPRKHTAYDIRNPRVHKVFK